MSYFGGRDVPPAPNADDAPFWEYCAKGRLAFQRCNACGAVTHPPLAVCPRCQSLDRGWIDAPATGRVFSFTWIHTAAHEAVAECIPYNVAVVEFPDLPGVRLVTNVVDAAPGELAIGDRVTVRWENINEGMALPRFVKR